MCAQVTVDAFAPAARSVVRADVRRQVFQQDPDQKRGPASGCAVAISRAPTRDVTARHRRAPLRRPLTAANEPEEFFASDFESMAPEEKLKDPLVLLGLGSIFLPFIMILGFQYVAASQGFLLILHLTPRLRGDTPSPRRRLNAWSAQGDGRDLG